MSSKIEQTIEELEQYIDTCKPQAFSSNKIIVNKDQIEELLTELRLRTPEEIKRYQKMISNKEAILADAQTKADAIISGRGDAFRACERASDHAAGLCTGK